MPEAPEAFHRTLSQLPKEMVTRAELARRLGWNRESVDRVSASTTGPGWSR